MRQEVRGQIMYGSEFTAGHGTRIVLEETLQIRDSVREAINDMEVSTRDLPLLAGMALLSGYCLKLPSCDWKSFRIDCHAEKTYEEPTVS